MQLFGFEINPFHIEHEPEDRHFGVKDLSEEEQIIYKNVVKQLSHHFSERVGEVCLDNYVTDLCERDCTVTFRQSKSWSIVDKMFHKLMNTQASDKIKFWAEEWKTEIEGFEKSKDALNKMLIKEREIKERQPNFENPADDQNDQSIAKSAIEIRDKIKICGKTLLTHLKQKRAELLKPDIYLRKNNTSNEIIKYLNNNWDSLILFAKYSSIKLADEKIFITIEKDKNSRIGKHIAIQKIDESVKAIFSIGEICAPATLPLEYDGEPPRIIIRPTKIDVKDSHLPPESPELRNELFFDLHTGDYNESISETAIKLEIIVHLAIKSVNLNISGNVESSNSNQASLYGLFPFTWSWFK